MLPFVRPAGAVMRVLVLELEEDEFCSLLAAVQTAKESFAFATPEEQKEAGEAYESLNSLFLKLNAVFLKNKGRTVHE